MLTGTGRLPIQWMDDDARNHARIKRLSRTAAVLGEDAARGGEDEAPLPRPQRQRALHLRHVVLVLGGWDAEHHVGEAPAPERGCPVGVSSKGGRVGAWMDGWVRGVKRGMRRAIDVAQVQH